ncbi:MAG TPA: hypothetical protein ENF54_04600 [Desulfobacteraceae bacterium]|nr:hypothetical protein [Desulfobacteraceae bacterium]
MKKKKVKETLSSSQELSKSRTFGKVRCHNPSCMDRIEPPPGADRVKCPRCGMEYRLVWVNPQLPRIRGPVWEVNRRIAEERIKQLQSEGKL